MGIPRFTPQENMRRIKRERNTKFIIVEGEKDVPLYEITLKTQSPQSCGLDWDIVSSGGKLAVEKLLQESSAVNFICIIDRDFDQNEYTDDRVITLGRYSIENYFFCKTAISCALAVALSCRTSDINQVFSLSPLVQDIQENATVLAAAAFNYQKKHGEGSEGKRISWSSSQIHQDAKGQPWRICKKSIAELTKILLQKDTEKEALENFYNIYGPNQVTAYTLPGKMLLVPLQRFIWNFYKSQRKKGGNQLSSPEALSSTLVAYLHHSPSFSNIIKPAVDFIS